MFINFPPFLQNFSNVSFIIHGSRNAFRRKKVLHRRNLCDYVRLSNATRERMCRAVSIFWQRSKPIVFSSIFSKQVLLQHSLYYWFPMRKTPINNITDAHNSYLRSYNLKTIIRHAFTHFVGKTLEIDNDNRT